jgi:hypothetical protein
MTIAVNGWHMDGQACPWSGIEHTNLPPASTPVNDDSFPFWYGVRHVINSGGN